MVFRIHRTARKGDLTGMLAQIRGALGEDDAGVFAVVDDGDEDCGVLQMQGLEIGYDARVQQEVAVIAPGSLDRPPRLLQRAATEFVGGVWVTAHRDKASSSAAGMIGKIAPADLTQNISTPSTAMVSPSSTMSYITGRETSASSRPRTWR